MEDPIKDLESKNRKTLKEYCIKNYFLLEDKNKKNLEYSDEEVKLFLDRIIKIKNEKEEKLVSSYKDILKKKESTKSINKNLYKDLFEIEIGYYPYEFLFALLQDLENDSFESLLTLKYFTHTYEREYECYLEKREARFLIRNQKPLSLEEKKIDSIPYNQKIESLKKIIFNNFKFEESNTYRDWFIEIFRKELSIEDIALDIIQQLIVYDILHESIPKEIQELNYNKINAYLDEWMNKVEKYYKEYYNGLSKSDIRKDDLEIRFFSFINFNTINKQRKELIEIYKEVDKMKIEVSEKIIDKKDNFYEQLRSLTKNIQNQDIQFLIYDFKDLDVAKKLIKNSIDGKISYIDILEALKEREEEVIDKNISNLKAKINKKSEKLLEWLNGLSNPNSEYNMDLKEAIFQISENDKHVLKVFRKKLWNLINEKTKMYIFEIIDIYLRVKVTYINYKQKGILENFRRSYLIEEKINKILEIINRIKKDKMRYEYKEEFFNNMLDMLATLNLNKYVVKISEETISNINTERYKDELYIKIKKRFLLRSIILAPNLCKVFISEEKIAANLNALSKI